MEEGRVLPTVIKEKPTLFIPKLDYSFAKDMDIGDKGIINFTGSLNREYLDENEEIIKIIKVSKLNNKSDIARI